MRKPTLKLEVYVLDEQGQKRLDIADLGDGVRSVVRTAVFGDPKKYGPIYR